MLKNQKGAALIFVLMMFTVFSILFLAMLGSVVTNQRMSYKDKEFQETYYIAESGVTKRMEAFKDEVMQAYHSTANQTSFFHAIETVISPNTVINNYELAQGIQPTATVTISRISPLYSNPSVYTITSMGVIDDSTRVVTKDISLRWVTNNPYNFQMDMTVFSINNVGLLNGSINGPLGTNASGPSAINISGNPNIDDVYLLPGAGLSAQTWWLNNWTNGGNHKNTLPGARTYGMPIFPTYPEYSKKPDDVVSGSGNTHRVIDNGSVNITSYLAHNYILDLDRNAYIPEININSNRNLYIDVGDKNREIVIGKLNLNSGHIILLGTGKLTIYIKDSINLSAGSTINSPANPSNATQVSDSIKKLLVYYEGDSSNKTITMSGSQKIYGSLYAKDADMNITAGSGFLGNVVTGGLHVNINGGTNVVTNFFYAPNAAVSISGGGTVNGPIVSNSFTLDGGASVTYNPSGGIVDNPFTVGNSIDDLIPIQGALREQ